MLRGEILGLEPEIRFYGIEDIDITEEGEEQEILIVNNSNLTEYKKPR